MQAPLGSEPVPPRQAEKGGNGFFRMKETLFVTISQHWCTGIHLLQIRESSKVRKDSVASPLDVNKCRTTCSLGRVLVLVLS